uniref:Uncharacterized protein n=1 Tax=Rhizophora mucronata TaxID=61149 RepID=A0A2P2PC23_RHIMU
MPPMEEMCRSIYLKETLLPTSFTGK